MDIIFRSTWAEIFIDEFDRVVKPASDRGNAFGRDNLIDRRFSHSTDLAIGDVNHGMGLW